MTGVGTESSGSKQPPTPLIDERALAELVEDLGDADFVDSMLKMYLDQLPSRVADLQAAVKPPIDRAAVRFRAHSLRSASSQLGIAAIADLATVIEFASDADSEEQLSSSTDQLTALATATGQVLTDRLTDLIETPTTHP